MLLLLFDHIRPSQTIVCIKRLLWSSVSRWMRPTRMLDPCIYVLNPSHTLNFQCIYRTIFVLYLRWALPTASVAGSLHFWRRDNRDSPEVGLIITTSSETTILERPPMQLDIELVTIPDSRQRFDAKANTNPEYQDSSQKDSRTTALFTLLVLIRSTWSIHTAITVAMSTYFTKIAL